MKQNNILGLRHTFTRLGSLVLLTLALAKSATAQANVPPPEKMLLWPAEAPIGDGTTEPKPTASITLHRPAAGKANGTALIICPGGGYGGLVTGAEGHGIAKWIGQFGVTGIVLEYRLPKGRPFVPLLDAQRAIRTARSRAADWNIKPQSIGIIGFSAGGHLASTAATHFDSGNIQATDPIERVSSRPDFAILVYPVVSMGEKGHKGSRNNLLGPNPKPELIELFSNEKQVTDRTPPIFLTHAKNDTVVVPENSQMLYDALKEKKIPTEYVELAEGGHGLNGYKGPMWDLWQLRSVAWLVGRGFLPARDAEK